MTTITHIQGTTYEGMEIQIDVNGNPLDLTDADIDAVFTYECDNGKGYKEKAFAIGTGVSDVNALGGSFILLKDTLIDWVKGKWYLTVTFTLQDGSIKKYIYNTVILQVK